MMNAIVAGIAAACCFLLARRMACEGVSIPGGTPQLSALIALRKSSWSSRPEPQMLEG